MANIKSAKKRIKVIQAKTLRNKMIRSSVKTAVRKVNEAVAAGDAVQAKQALINAVSTLDKAKSKGVMHKNTASRKVSRLTKKVNTIA